MKHHEKLVWDQKLSVDHEGIDLQHRKIFNIINEFIDEDRITPKSALLAQLLSKLTDYGLEHFREEERYMRENSYPRLEEHLKEHRKYTYKIAMFNMNFNDANATNPAEVIDYLKRWWIDHIETIDMDYKDYISKL